MDSTNSLPDTVEDDQGDLQECSTCNRKFNDMAYNKHVKICSNVFVKKRKEFNMKQKRIVAQE